LKIHSTLTCNRCVVNWKPCPHPVASGWDIERMHCIYEQTVSMWR